MIPADELAAMQAAAALTFDKTATVQRITPAPDGYGHMAGTPTTVGTIPCRVATPKGPMYAQAAAKLSLTAVILVTFAASADVRKGDRLIIEGSTLFVHLVGAPESHSTANSAMCGEDR